MPQDIGSEMMKCSIQTTTKLHEIRSTIANVSKLPTEREVSGPDFYLAPECMCSISFRKGKTHLFVYICNKSDSEIKLETKIVLLDCNYRTFYKESNARIFSIGENQRMDVIGYVHKSGYDALTNDTLIIDLCVSIKEVLTKTINPLICDTDPGRKLREDFKAMLENPVNSDVSLQVGGERIPAHWSVLCSRSPYFKKMFDSGMLERVQNSITVTDLSLGTLKKLIEFLYAADFVENADLQELCDLYYAADKYEVMDLRTLCGHKIMSIATADNLCQILQLAHRHNDKGLKRQMMDFIQRQSDAVFQTEGWKKFEASEPLVAEVFSFFCLKEN